MLPEKVRKSNIAAVVWFVSMFALLAMIGSDEGGNIWDEGNWPAIAVFSVHGISLFVTLWFYAEAKGYSGFLGIGLAFLYAFGLVILLFLKDKNKEGSTQLTNDQATPNKWWKAYLVAIFVVLIGAVVGFGQTHTHPTFAVGYYLFPSIVVAAISYATIGRGGGKLVGTTIFVAVYAALIVGSLLSAQIQKQEAAEGIEYFLDQAEELGEAQFATNDDGTPKLIDKTFSADPRATGVMAEAQVFMADLLNQSAQLTNSYQMELDNIGWGMILDADRMQNDIGFQESWRLLEAGRQVVHKYKARSLQVLTDSTSSIQNLNLSATEKREFKEGYERGLAKSMATHEGIWDLEIATFDEFEKLINFLAEDPRFWSAEEGQFLFDTQEQLDVFNEHLEKIDSFVQQQMELQKANVEAQRDKLKDL